VLLPCLGIGHSTVVLHCCAASHHNTAGMTNNDFLFFTVMGWFIQHSITDFTRLHLGCSTLNTQRFHSSVITILNSGPLHFHPACSSPITLRSTLVHHEFMPSSIQGVLDVPCTPSAHLCYFLANPLQSSYCHHVCLKAPKHCSPQFSKSPHHLLRGLVWFGSSTSPKGPCAKA
jgi:hypothetical protein